jgi:periplasmic protein CpxP/Spy
VPLRLREGAHTLFSPINVRDRKTARWRSALGVFWIALGSGAALCQQGPPPPNNPPGQNMGPPPMEGRRPPMERAFHLGPRGRWWNNPEFAQKLGLTADQQKKMEAVFQQSRPNLMDLSATVRSQEAAMEPLLGADQPDETKILAQIDRVAQARAELEKANARMLLGLRRILTPDQWKTLQADEPKGEFGGYHPHFGPPPGSAGDPGPNP